MAGPYRGSRRTWGWHSLADEWARLIVADAGISPGDLVLDIGAGTGALTAQLLAAEARVIAIELHPDRLRDLRSRFRSAEVTIVCADAAAMSLPRRPFRVVASPPYAQTAALLRILLGPHSRLIAADLVLQKAVVARYAARLAPGAPRWQRRWTAQVGRSLPRRAFRPPPQVDSAVLIIRRR